MEKETVEAFKARMLTIKVPEGFTADFGEEAWAGTPTKVHHFFALIKPDDTVIKFDHNGGGHTQFKTAKGNWLSFDRTGVDDSFYHVKMWANDPDDIDLNAIVAEQLTRITERREYYKSAIKIPGIPFTVAPDGVEGLKKQLAGKNGHLTFTPSGFGTGYLITKKPSRGCRYGEKRAIPELEAFLGHSPLYVSTMDCD